MSFRTVPPNAQFICPNAPCAARGRRGSVLRFPAPPDQFSKRKFAPPLPELLKIQNLSTKIVGRPKCANASNTQFSRCQNARNISTGVHSTHLPAEPLSGKKARLRREVHVTQQQSANFSLHAARTNVLSSRHPLHHANLLSPSAGAQRK